jgi:hypothetical protein
MKDPRFVHVRCLDSKNPKSAKQKFFDPNILQEFDAHYTPVKAKEDPQALERPSASASVAAEKNIEIPNAGYADQIGGEQGASNANRA